MSRNVGLLDRVLRLVIAAILFWLAFMSQTAVAAGGLLFWVAVIVGLVLLVTAIVGSCPLYRLLGIKTCKEC